MLNAIKCGAVCNGIVRRLLTKDVCHFSRGDVYMTYISRSRSLPWSIANYKVVNVSLCGPFCHWNFQTADVLADIEPSNNSTVLIFMYMRACFAVCLCPVSLHNTKILCNSGIKGSTKKNIYPSSNFRGRLALLKYRKRNLKAEIGLSIKFFFKITIAAVLFVPSKYFLTYGCRTSSHAKRH